MKEEIQKSSLPPFLTYTYLKVHLLTSYFNQQKPDDTENEAWTFGGWSSYRFAWLRAVGDALLPKAGDLDRFAWTATGVTATKASSKSTA